MCESDALGMKKIPSERCQIIRKSGWRAVKCVPDDGVPDAGQMHAHLMCPAGENANIQQRETPIASQKMEAAFGGACSSKCLPGGRAGASGHARASAGVACDRRANHSVLFLNRSMHQCEVVFFHRLVRS